MAEVGLIQNFWRNRVVLLSAFGLVGVGAVIGAGSVYLFYFKKKFDDIFQIQSVLHVEVQNLRREVDKINQGTAHSNGVAGTSLGGGTEIEKKSIGGLSKRSVSSIGGVKRSVRFKDGYETADEDEYITASSDSEGEAGDLLRRGDAGVISAGNAVVCASGSGENWIDEFLKEIDRLLEGDTSSQHEAYIRLQTYKDKMENKCGFWWRFAKATHMEAQAAGQVGDNEMKKSLTFAGCYRAEQALQLDENSSDAHKWYAITLGSKGDFLSINERIQNGFIFKEHVDRAAQLNPNTDSSIHYLLGRFCFEVSTLGWVERRVASTLFSAPPSSTPEEALVHFQASERIGKPILKDNRLYMAKCYIAIKNYEQAAYWLQKCVDMPVVSTSDKPIHEEAVKLFAKYKQYLK